jgi:hypothetical protein
MNRDLSHIGNRFAHLANVCVNKDKFADQTASGEQVSTVLRL